MRKQVTIVESNRNNTAAKSADRFLYAEGARPLDGYTIRRGVGQGGFGEIYFATSDAGKEVALKLIRRNLEVELRGIRQCLNLKHPNLLSLHDIRTDSQGDSWVVMEYVADENLEDVLTASPNGLPIERAVAWIQGAAAGVAYLHQRGIVHRDLKPGNIFRDEGIVKIGDYGLSKFISCSRRSGHTESIGTVHYMAPEVANGRYGKEIDVYALGVLFYELLTGRVPFDGESVGEVLMKHLTAKPNLSILPERFRGVIGKALEKDPEQRYRSADEFVADIKHVAQPPSAVNGKSASIHNTQPGAAVLHDDFPQPGAAVLHGHDDGRGFIRRHFSWHERAIPAVLVKPMRERLAELAGSLLVGTLTAAAMCVVATVLEGYFYSDITPKLEQFAWLLSVSTLCVAAILIPAKQWEGFRGEPVVRRFVMLVVGLVVGAASCGLARALAVALYPAAGYPDPPDFNLPPIFYDSVTGQPLLMAYVACIGTLFFIFRWWRQADPLRKRRFSFNTVFWCVLLAWLIAHLWEFPQPMLPMIAGVVSVSVQLAAPWLRPAERRRR